MEEEEKMCFLFKLPFVNRAPETNKNVIFLIIHEKETTLVVYTGFYLYSIRQKNIPSHIRTKPIQIVSETKNLETKKKRKQHCAYCGTTPLIL